MMFWLVFICTAALTSAFLLEREREAHEWKLWIAECVRDGVFSEKGCAMYARNAMELDVMAPEFDPDLMYAPVPKASAQIK